MQYYCSMPHVPHGPSRFPHPEVLSEGNTQQQARVHTEAADFSRTKTSSHTNPCSTISALLVAQVRIYRVLVPSYYHAHQVGGGTSGAGNRSSTESPRKLGLPPRWSSHGDAQSMVTVAEAGEYSEEGGKEGPRTANDSDLSGTSGGKGGTSGTSRWMSALSPPPEGSGYRETSPRPLNPEELVSGQRRHNSIGVVRATTSQNAHQGPLSQSSSPAEHGVDGVSRGFRQLGLGRGGGVQPAIPRTRLGTRRASAPPERGPEHRARAGQRGTGSSAVMRSSRVLERLAIVSASLAAAAEEAEEASQGDLSSQSRPNCVVPSAESSDVWEEPVGGNILSERTQGDLLRRQRARGVASDPVGR